MFGKHKREKGLNLGGFFDLTPPADFALALS
jgi:hypothetical protein